jgi:hypothetical protein
MKIIPEYGLLALLGAVLGTFGLCFIMEKLLGQYGAIPSLVGGLILGMEAKKLAIKYSNDQENSNKDN